MDEVQEPIDLKLSIRLAAIQGVGTTIEMKIETARAEMHVRRGAVAGMIAGGSIIDKIMQTIQKDIDESKIEEVEARAVLKYFNLAKTEFAQAVALNQKDQLRQEGIIEGLSKAVGECEGLYKQEITKAQQRISEALRGKRDEGGRPLSVNEQQVSTLPTVVHPKE